MDERRERGKEGRNWRKKEMSGQEEKEAAFKLKRIK